MLFFKKKRVLKALKAMDEIYFMGGLNILKGYNISHFLFIERCQYMLEVKFMIFIWNL